MKAKTTLVFFIVCSLLQNLLAQNKLSDRDKFIEALLSKMTLEEKVGQMNIIVGETIVTGPTMYTSTSDKFDELIKKGKITGLFNVYGAAYTKRLQQIAIEQSRLKIPLLFGADVIHGFKTVTPIPLGEAASWDLDAIERSARLTAKEASAAGINFNFAPMVDIARDPRWGRMSEGSGEDPYLGSLIAAARVKGYQGTDLKAANTVAACVKHFAAYGAAEAGRDYNTTDLSQRALFETYLPPYKAAIDAGAATMMSSFNEFDGIPATANKNLLTDILRNKWKFNGLIVSDYGSIGELRTHGVAANGPEAAKLALEAGTDMDMMSYLFLNEIPGMVESGKINIKYVDDAVRRVLTLKYDLGLFEDPYRYSNEQREKADIRSQENFGIARDIAKRSIVLLKNNNQLLPIKKSVHSIAVIGPLADNKEDMNGSWSFFGEPQHPITILQGIKERAGKDVNVLYHQGCDLYADGKDKFADAQSVAKQADVVIMAVGESAVMNGEGASRANIGLPGVQEDLVKAIVSTGRPVVVLLLNGRPLTIEWLNENVPAILDTWTLGSEAGHAVADVLFGDYNPAAKLPVTFPRSVGQVPIYYSHKNTGRPYYGDYKEPLSQRIYQSKYRDEKNSPLYPFGYGLSYTTFEYSDITLNNAEIDMNGKLEASVTVTNKGSYDGEEVVQLYVRDLVGSVTRPVKELKGFRKIFLKVGEATKVTFTLTAQDLAFYRADMSWGAEPGSFEIYIGTNSDDVKKKSFELKDTISK
jgi:beta-glucosidase